MDKPRGLFKRRNNKAKDETTSKSLVKKNEKDKELSTDLKENRKVIAQQFGNTLDFKLDTISIGKSQGIVCYLETMIDKSSLQPQLFQPLESINENENIVNEELEVMRKEIFPGLAFSYCTKLSELIWHVLSGYVVILVENKEKAIAIEIGNVEKRGVEEPTSQSTVRGPKDGFTELLSTNISLIRRRLKNQNLRFEQFQLGRDTNTSVAIGYIEGVTNRDILDEVRKRVKSIDTSAILDSGNMEEYLADKSFTPFPLVYNSERPDSITAGLTEGKVAIIVDGSPFVLTVPTVFIEFFQASEDYYHPFFVSSFVRVLRFVSFMVALVFPSIYVAVTTFHHELLPTQLLISIQAQREGVPFPAVVEILLMEFTFEVLREAGIRMPRAVGQTVSIVGALVIGQAAVEAGIVSNVLVIIVAFTGIASFVIPIYTFTIYTRLIRFALILIASFLGLYGILLALVVMVVHLTSLRSFGVPYLAPVAPFIPSDQQDVFLRFPIWANKDRPTYLKASAPKKSKNKSKPSPPETEPKAGDTE
jgi:spore germination protein KA